MIKDIKDEKIISIEKTADGRIRKTVELQRRTPEPVTIARRYLSASSNLNWYRGAGNAEDIQKFARQRDALAKQLESGASPIPVNVFYDGSVYYLADGFLQNEALKRLHRDPVVIIWPGNQGDAEAFALSTGAATLKNMEVN